MRFRVILFSLIALGWASLVSGQSFTEIDANLPAVWIGSAEWGDYDNDGDLDVVIVGFDIDTNRITEIYENENGTFTNINAGLTGLGAAAAAWGDYDGDGDLDLAVAGNLEPNVYASYIYRNDGNDVFTDIDAPLADVTTPMLDWVDADNDGDLDLLLSGDRGSSDGGTISALYQNEGNDTFSNTGTPLQAAENGDNATGDLNGDGWTDLIITGASGESGLYVFEVYINNGDGSFANPDFGLPPIRYSSIDVGDYDMDGDLDVAATGNISGNDHVADILENDGTGLVPIEAGLSAVRQGSVRWGDYDNDGDLDLILTGDLSANDPVLFTEMYENIGGGEFTMHTTSIIGLRRSSIDWGDYDNDGALDILITGANPEEGRVARLYQNDEESANTPPETIPDIETSLDGSTVTFSWEETFDDETDGEGLTYNLRVGTTSGGDEILSGMAETTGQRLVPQLGNVGHHLEWTLNNLPDGVYYWSVQAIDNGFTGSEFAEEQSFVIGETPSYSISGMVNYRDEAQPVPVTTLELTSGDLVLSEVTDVSGLFSFSDLDMADYTLTANKEGDIAGISAFDAALVVRHAAQIELLDDLAQVAADVTGNGDISPFDAARIAQYAASLPHDSQTGEWTFLPSSYSYLPLDSDQADQNFSAILYGDVSGDWAARQRSKAGATLEPQSATPVIIDQNNVRLADLHSGIFAFQFVIESDERLNVSLAETVPADWEWVTHQIDEHRWSIVAYGATELQDTRLLTLSTSAVELRSGLINETPVTFTKTGDQIAVPAQVTLYGNYPNPFNPQTSIKFDLNQAANLTLRVYDISGKLVNTLVDHQVDAGTHTVEWSGFTEDGERVGSGVYFYQLTTDTGFSQTKSMILLK